MGIHGIPSGIPLQEEGSAALLAAAMLLCEWRLLPLRRQRARLRAAIDGEDGGKGRVAAMLTERSRTQNAAERERSRTRTQHPERRTQ
eukprot:gene16136-biopygen5880